MQDDCILLMPCLQPLQLPCGHVLALMVAPAVRHSDLIVTLVDCRRKVSSLRNATTDPLRSMEAYP